MKPRIPSTTRACRTISYEGRKLPLAGGVGPPHIARILNISVHTCRGYVKSLYAKLGVGSQLEALATARTRGLIGRGYAAPP